METSCLDSDLDRLSDLPHNVLVNILAWLPLKDAIRTSTLSKKWRRKWWAMPRIIIKETTFHHGQQCELVGIINYILIQHEGKIEKCSIFLNKAVDSYSMKSWILRLLQKSVQELTLKAKFYSYKEVPCELFSCEQLRKLKLRCLEFKPPHSFTGFNYLISLRLTRVFIATGELESLITKCSNLKRLTLKSLSCVDHLCVNNPNIKYFRYDGEFKSISFNTPVLAVLSINLFRFGYKRSEYDLRFKIRGLPPSIQELYVRCRFHRFLASGNRLMDSTSCIHLKTLKLDDFCFKKLYEVSSLLSLLQCFPNLHMLEITACKCKVKDEHDLEDLLKFWEERNLTSCLEQLQNVKVRSFHGDDHELRFIEFVLGNSPLLKEMIIEAKDELSLDIMGQLNKFRRSSPEVVVQGIQSPKKKKTQTNTNGGAREPPPGNLIGPPGPPLPNHMHPLGPQHHPYPGAMPPGPPLPMLGNGNRDDFSSTDTE